MPPQLVWVGLTVLQLAEAVVVNVILELVTLFIAYIIMYIVPLCIRTETELKVPPIGKVYGSPMNFAEFPGQLPVPTYIIVFVVSKVKAYVVATERLKGNVKYVYDPALRVNVVGDVNVGYAPGHGVAVVVVNAIFVKVPGLTNPRYAVVPTAPN